MDAFVWDDTFATGIESVDAQHRELVDLVNQLGAALIEGQAPNDAYMEEVIAHLRSYATFHFFEEELLMADAGIAATVLEEHHASHTAFVEQLASLWSLRRSTSTTMDSLLKFLMAWLTFHILGEDQSMARQIARIAAGASAADALAAEETPQNKGSNALLGALDKVYQILAQQNKELVRINQYLEERVAERTRELEEANLALSKLSRTDGLLGIANRMHFNQMIEQEWRRGRRNKSPLALLMIDVDHFKRYNDFYGHLRGDECLRRAAKVIAAELHRPADQLARYGGEEFVALLPETSAEGALHLGEAICAAFGSALIPHAASLVADHVTVSVGAAALLPACGEGCERLIALADEALYAAKEGGRNRVRLAARA